MHVGAFIVIQNLGDGLSDYEAYRDGARLADLAEPLGYDSIWAAEHHFTGYGMCPDALQFLSYMAGRTERVKLGSTVALPWHDPVRLAEELVMLDHLSDGRVIIGVERGLARVEHEGFGLDMAESRGRFVESARMLVSALETGCAEFDGSYVRQPRVEIRPAPFRSFRGRTYAAAISPESSVVLAILGMRLLIIPQKPWHEAQAALATYRSTYREVNGADPPAPAAVVFVYCDEDAERAARMSRRYVGAYWESVMRHYGLRRGHLKTTRGYEYFGDFIDDLNSYGEKGAQDFFISLQVTGTPEQCYRKVMDIHSYTGIDSLVAAFSYGGMPHTEAERSMRRGSDAGTQEAEAGCGRGLAAQMAPDFSPIVPVSQQRCQTVIGTNMRGIDGMELLAAAPPEAPESAWVPLRIGRRAGGG